VSLTAAGRLFLARDAATGNERELLALVLYLRSRSIQTGVGLNDKEMALAFGPIWPRKKYVVSFFKFSMSVRYIR